MMLAHERQNSILLRQHINTGAISTYNIDVNAIRYVSVQYNQ